MTSNRPLHVTSSFLPPLNEYIAYLEKIWDSKQVTNNGPFVRKLESQLAHYLEAKHVIPVTNGDTGLRLALRALEVSGEVITTPLTYVSTLSSIAWSGLTPVFADIQKDSLTIDPQAVEEAITARTGAIMATHVYGIPCDVRRLETIADKYGLRLIYDAAHAFGVNYLERRLTNFGEVSMVSLHGTKLFHTCEGGILVTDDDQIAERLEWMRRSGHRGTEAFHGLGINAKMSELHAAMGLCNLKHLDFIIDRRKRAWEAYKKLLCGRYGLSLPRLPETTSYNYAYFPVLFRSEADLQCALQTMAERNIFPRRYFYPALNQVAELGARAPMPVADDVSCRVLCLPLSESITRDDVQQVVDAIEIASRLDGAQHAQSRPRDD